MTFSTDPGDHWEELARRAPYFAVLTDEKYDGAAAHDTVLAAFFESGREHFRRVLSVAGADRFDSALDFGCGVGRVTLAIAAHAREITGVDVSPTMLERARSHAEREGAGNVAWQSVDELLAGKATFDLVHSFLVLQHVPVRKGMALLSAIAERVRTPGLLVVQLPYWRKGSALHRALRTLRANVAGVNALANLLGGRPAGAPYMQMNAYDLAEVLRRLFALRFRSVRIVEEGEGDVRSVLIFGWRD
jgi:2-polyprenyl-3-methyl-5-hydroxy-6-metoxy-1,4-benzoquinol methylase